MQMINRWLLILAALASVTACKAAPRTDKRDVVPPGRATHPQRWIEQDLARGLLIARRSKRPLFVEVFAHWCAPCNTLNNEVLHTALGRRLLQRAVGVRVDFETPAGRDVTSRYSVLNLPTTLVLDHTGKELGRIDGYPGRKEYVQRLDDALAGRLNLKAMSRRAAAAPGDLKLKAQLAQALLVRGRVREAEAILLPMSKLADASGARACRIWGRYLLRVKRQKAAALAHFAAAMTRFKGTKFWAHFLYWTAKSHQDLGQKTQALALFDQWVAGRPGAFKPLSWKADFMVHFKYDPVATERVVQAALAIAPKKEQGEQAWLHYLQAQLHLRRKNRAAAATEIRKALALDPKTAIFRNFALQVNGTGTPRKG